VTSKIVKQVIFKGGIRDYSKDKTL